MTSSEAPPKVSGRGARRLRLLEEAARQLNTRGVSQTSLAEIAKRAGVSRAALYYYFDDQADLVFQSYRRSCETIARRLNEAVRTSSHAMETIERFVDGLLGPDQPEIAGLNEAAFLRQDQQDTIHGLYEGIMATIAEILNAGARRGELRPCGADVVAQAILGLVSWAPMARRWLTSATLTDQDLVDAIKSLLVYGVAADRRAPPVYRRLVITPGVVPAGRVFDTDVLAAAKQEALLAAASWLFNLKGVDATSLDEIAERVGVTKKVIYHNVGDKAALLAACHRRAFVLVLDVGERVAAYDGSRLEAVCAGFHANAESQLREDIAPLAPIGGFEALPYDVRMEINPLAEQLMDSYLETFRLGQAEGSIRPLNARAFNAIRPGMLEWLPKWYRVQGEAARERCARELAVLTAVGLLPLEAPAG